MRISRVPQLLKTRLAVPGVSLAMAGTLLGAGLTGTAHAAAGAAYARARTADTRIKPTTGVEPTIVLVHGAFAAAPESLAYVAAFDPRGEARDALAVLGCVRSSATYGVVVGGMELPTGGAGHPFRGSAGLPPLAGGLRH